MFGRSTGWAQVNGRNAITWDKKFSLDIWYVDNHSLILDLKIIFLTIKRFLISQVLMMIGVWAKKNLKVTLVKWNIV